MATLHRIVHIEKATIEDLNCTPVEKGPKSVLLIKCPLSPLMADILGCSYVFTEDGVPVEHLDKVSLEQKLAHFLFKLPSATDHDVIEQFQPELAWKFNVTRDATEMKLSFRVHVSGAAQAHQLLDIANTHQGKEFTVTLQSIQGNLFDEFEGESVDMAGGETEPTCSFCQDKIPLDERDPLLHTNGSACDRAEFTRRAAVGKTGTEPGPDEPQELRGAALASWREVNGNQSRRGKKAVQ